MIRLDQENFEVVRQLFKEVSYQLSAEAVLSGNNPGGVLADQYPYPQAAFMHSPEGNILVGDVKQEQFIKNLALYLRDDYFLKQQKKGEDTFGIYCEEKWEEVVIHRLLKDMNPMKHPRLHYLLIQNDLCSEPYVELGDLQWVAVNDELLNSSRENVEEVRSRVDEWGSRQAFYAKAFGYCLVNQNTVVSRCIADCIDGDRCELGIGTDQAYRHKGLATWTVWATAKACFSRGMTQIGWHTSKYNIASQKTAEKVGFKLKTNYYEYWTCYQIFDRYYQNGFHYVFELRDDVQADHFFQKANQQQKLSYTQILAIARAFAIVGQTEYMMNYLKSIKHWDTSCRNFIEQEHAFNPYKRDIDRLLS